MVHPRVDVDTILVDGRIAVERRQLTSVPEVGGAGLSFLGLGAVPATPELGAMLADGITLPTAWRATRRRPRSGHVADPAHDPRTPCQALGSRER